MGSKKTGEPFHKRVRQEMRDANDKLAQLVGDESSAVRRAMLSNQLIGMANAIHNTTLPAYHEPILVELRRADKYAVDTHNLDDGTFDTAIAWVKAEHRRASVKKVHNTKKPVRSVEPGLAGAETFDQPPQTPAGKGAGVFDASLA